MAYDYQLLEVVISGRIATVTINNPPINIITPALYQELVGLVAELKDDDSLTVIVFKSADPDFFIAHYDVSNILKFPTEGDAERNFELSDFHTMCERVRTMNKVTIAQIEGRVGGGGSEFAASMDMRFGVIDKTIINQMEVPLGILPGGSGTQRLPRLVGRGRAMEIVLGADDLDAQTAERWGYLNRIYRQTKLTARWLRWLSVSRVFRWKRSGWPKPRLMRRTCRCNKVCKRKAYLFARLLRTESAQANMTRFMQIGGQTREGELRVAELSRQLGETH